MSAKLVPTFADREVSRGHLTEDPYGAAGA
jgi:hypothetical protein